MRNAFILPLATVVILYTLLPLPLKAQMVPDRPAIVRVVDSLGNDAVKANRIASVSVAMVRAADTLVLRAWGQAKRDEPARAADASTVY